MMRIDLIFTGANVAQQWRGRVAVVMVAALMTAGVANPAWAEEPPDTTAPVITDMGIADGARVNKAVALRPTVSDDVAVVQVDFLINGAVVAKRTARPWSHVWNTLAVTSGSATVEMIAHDAAGNTSAPAVARVHIDNQAPTVAFAPMAEKFLHGVVSIPFQVSDQDADLAKIELYKQPGTVLASTIADPWTITWDSTRYTGNVQVEARAYDTLGNVAVTYKTMHVDNTPPVLTVNYDYPAAPGHVRAGGPLSVSVNDYSGFRRVDLLVGGKTVSSATSPGYGVAELRFDPAAKSGPTTMTVRAEDNAGNVTTESYGVIVDNEAPIVTLSPADKVDVPRKFTIGATAVRDLTGLASMLVESDTIDSGGLLRSGPWRITSSWGQEGWQTFTVRMCDKAVNCTTLRRTVYIDTDKPAVSFSKAPKNKSRLTRTVKITAKAADNRAVTRVQMLVNGKVMATDGKAAYRFTLNPKKYGKKFTVQLRAYDRAGNVKYSSKRTYVR
jgi:hypothetical protein